MKSFTKITHMTEFILWIWTSKYTFFEGWSWFKFNNLGLTLDMALKIYTRVAKGFKLKVRKFLGPIPTFAEITVEKLVRGAFLHPFPHSE